MINSSRFLVLISFMIYSGLAQAVGAGECKAKGGKWGGTQHGRGQIPGCNMPTKDAGKECKTGDDCESVCLRDHKCYGWQQYRGCAFFKGHDGLICVD